MKDVTEVFDHFRVSARGIWNTAFWPDQDFRNWDSREVFDEIGKLLFSELVLEKLSVDWPSAQIFRGAIPHFKLAPKSQESTVLVQRSEFERGYWDHEVKTLRQGEAELHFIDYFDWDHMAYADFRYYRARIASFPKHPETEGLEVLLEHDYFSVFI